MDHVISFSFYCQPSSVRSPALARICDFYRKEAQMAAKRTTSRTKKSTTAPKKPRERASPRSKAVKKAAKKPSARSPKLELQHARVTAGRSQQRAIMGMHNKSHLTHAGKTTHFDVSYLSSLGQQGATLGQAILQNCERDYTALQQIFGGITPHRLPFVVQITSDSTGASHSSCLGTDISVGGKSGGNVDFIRSLLVAEADEVFMANFGHGWDCGASPGEGIVASPRKRSL
jgi:hypothetical protein